MSDINRALHIEPFLDGMSYYSIEGFEENNDMNSVIKNQEEDENIMTITEQPHMEVIEEEEIIVHKPTRIGILRTFWEKHKIWLIIALIIVALIIFLLLYFVVSGSGQKEPVERLTVLSPGPTGPPGQDAAKMAGNTVPIHTPQSMEIVNRIKGLLPKQQLSNTTTPVTFRQTSPYNKELLT